jgi:hypothetical protein
VTQETLPLPDDGSSSRVTPLSPKRPLTETTGLADIFPYYAGFSFDWACAKLTELSSGDGACVVLDPWNGAGTTTQAARYDGNPAVGIDRNPVATLVAQLRCVVGKYAVATRPPRASPSTCLDRSDPLTHWLGARTVSRIRDWTMLLDTSDTEMRALGMVSMFRAVRSLTRKFEGSNPTWVKVAASESDKIDLAADELDGRVVSEQDALLKRLASDPGGGGTVDLLTASAMEIPLADGSVDVILTSPPYLTRIDYAIAYSRELAVLDVDVLNGRELRSSLMGTTLIRPMRQEDSELGEVATDLIRRVSSHPSKASGGYYLKQAKQYLNDFCISLDEITRVAKYGAWLCMVVQDSFYKDEPVPLADICINEAVLRGWVYKTRSEFPVIRSLTSLNSSARKYKKNRVDESVVTFRFGHERAQG